MEKVINFFKTPFGIILAILSIIGIVMLIGWKWFGWFSNSIEQTGFPSSPNVGDTFVKGGIKYTFTCEKTPNVSANQPCNGSWMTDKQVEDNNSIQRISNSGSTMKGSFFGAPQNFSAERTVGGSIPVNPVRKKCWEIDITDSAGRCYHYEGWALDCSALYVSDARHLVQNAKDNGNFNASWILNTNQDIIIHDSLLELELKYSTQVNAGLMSFKANKCIEARMASQSKQWSFAQITEQQTRHITILKGQTPPPHFSRKQLVTVEIKPNLQATPQNYSAHIEGIDPNNFEVIVDVPYNSSWALGNGRIIY